MESNFLIWNLSLIICEKKITFSNEINVIDPWKLICENVKGFKKAFNIWNKGKLPSPKDLKSLSVM